MPIIFETDETLQRVTVTIPAGTRWAAFETAARAAIARTPDLTDWMWIIDDQGPIEDIDVEGMVRIGEDFRRFSRPPLRRTYTIVVTQDRHFDTWLRVVDLNHENRKHFPAPTLSAARALLDQLTGTDVSANRF
ncbi:MAG: hypothetical protein K2X25_01630 [Caulobacteraceae bacterium]|nr:hypothetical protein [Caulobacteraceae bacterium]